MPTGSGSPHAWYGAAWGPPAGLAQGWPRGTVLRGLGSAGQAVASLAGKGLQGGSVTQTRTWLASAVLGLDEH